MNYLLFCDVDTVGNLTDAFSGVNIIPAKQYDYFFFITDPDIINNLIDYKVDVANRILVKK